MDVRLSNLLIRATSLLACISLLLGVSLTGATHLGYADAGGAGFVTILFATVISIAAIVLANASHMRQAAELDVATDAAHRMAQGERFRHTAETGLLASLNEVSAYMDERSAHMRRIAAGDLSQNVEVRSDSDEFGDAMQTLVGNLRSTVGDEESKDRLQRSVVKLLDEVSSISDGDLTVQAEVGPEITGEIAEAFNHMTLNLRSLIRQVKDVTIQVASSANAINDTTEQLASGSVAQASQIARTTQAINEMAHQLKEVSQSAAASSEVAMNSLNRARTGTTAARDNINAMRSIRSQVQETAKRIKKLGERAQEIGQITGLIDDLSDRTAMLALNASLRASSGESSADGFAVVAEEVERLAERSNRLTQQIAGLTHTINLETSEVVASMEETIREVINGSAMADEAGRSLVEIEKVSSQLAEMLRTIADSARFQAKSSEDIAGSMASISEVSALVQNGSKRAADSARTLVDLSRDLRVSVAPFKLPVDLNLSLSGAEANRFIN